MEPQIFDPLLLVLPGLWYPQRVALAKLHTAGHPGGDLAGRYPSTRKRHGQPNRDPPNWVWVDPKMYNKPQLFLVFFKTKYGGVPGLSGEATLLEGNGHRIHKILLSV